jgi:predicted permease
MNNLALLNQVLIIFMMMLVGVYCRKRNIVDEKVNKGLTAILLNITLPLNIISAFNFQYSKEMITNMFIIFSFGLLVHPISFFIGKFVYSKFSIEEKNILIFSAVFSNCAFMAFPVLESLYGKIGILYGSAFLAPFNIYLWTLGVMLYEGDGAKFKLKNILNPGLISVAIGIVIFICSIRLPFAVNRCFEMIGSMTTPLSMIITGVIIGGMDVKKIFTRPSIYVSALVRLILIPVICALILRTIGLDEKVYGVCVLVAAMPVAAMATVFAENFGGDAQFASQNVFITTILSLLTIPVLALIFL